MKNVKLTISQLYYKVIPHTCSIIFPNAPIVFVGGIPWWACHRCNKAVKQIKPMGEIHYASNPEA